MTKDTDTQSDTIIDLDPDQVVENINTPAETVTRKPQKRNWLLGGVALLAAALGGGWLYKDVLAAYLPSDQMLAMTDKLAVLEASNSALREHLTNVDKLATQLKSDVDAMEGKDSELASLAEASQKAQGAAAAKVTALEQSLGEAKQSLADLAARPVVTQGGSATATDLTPLLQRIGNLEKDVASLKVKPAEAADNRAELTQVFSDLKAKIAAGTGYGDEYERINRMVPAASGLDVLQRHAALGLPDDKGLAGELRGLIGYLPKPLVPGPVPESEGWWAGLYKSMSELITIRVEGDVDWPSAASAAAALAESGDLPQAIEQLNRIEGTKPGGVQQWIDRANGRLALEAALKSVGDAVLRVIATKG
jgi:uncharacterized phage infection (PIP) family protein YhgE